MNAFSMCHECVCVRLKNSFVCVKLGTRKRNRLAAFVSSFSDSNRTEPQSAIFSACSIPISLTSHHVIVVVHACSWRFDFHWTQHVFFFSFFFECKNVLRKSTNERRSDGKDHWYIQKKNLECEHLILLLIVQTDGITATITSFTLWNAEMLSNHIQNENTNEKTEEKRPRKLMDGNRRFVYSVVYSLLWNDITAKRYDVLLTFTCFVRC